MMTHDGWTRTSMAGNEHRVTQMNNRSVLFQYSSTTSVATTQFVNQDAALLDASVEVEVEVPVSQSGRDPYVSGPPLLSRYPARFDPPPRNEPHGIPIPRGNPALVRALHPYDMAQVDADYMGFIIVMERIWARFLRSHLEDFCRKKGPLGIWVNMVNMEVRRVMVLWASKEVVMREFPHEVQDARDRAHVEYESRVRCWHVRQHIGEYETSSILRLRELGYLIGG
ncbi:MAG: hypothetical protein Q9168_001488 [Polycauliona sp. 1 TL-2023]